MNDYLKSRATIQDNYENIVKTFQKGNTELVNRQVADFILHQPYNAERLYEIAYCYAQNGHLFKALHYLTEAFDTDEFYLYKALEEPVFRDLLSEEHFLDLEKRKLLRRLIQLQFHQVQPYAYAKVVLKFDLGSDHKINACFKSMAEDVKTYLKNPLLNFGHDEKNIKDNRCSVLESDFEPGYCRYNNILNGIVALAPFLHDVRFFIDNAEKPWVDEIVIANGEFFFYRHLTANQWYTDKIDLLKRVAEDYHGDTALHLFVSNVITQTAATYIVEATSNDEYRYARRLLRDALRFYPTNAFVYLQKAKLYERIGNFRLTEKAYARASQLTQRNVND